MKAERVPAIVPFPSGPPRSPGIHVSGVIRSMAADYGLLKKEWVEDLSLVEVGGGRREAWWNGLDDVSKIRMSMGLAWEQWYLPQLEGVEHQPGEMELDGVYMTHDGQSLSAITKRYTMAVHEVKTTYKSTNTVGNLEGEWMWLMQIKAYCKALHSRLAFLHILYPCGDYSYPIRPQLHVWRIEFEQWEIDEGWDLIRAYIHDRQGSEAIPSHVKTNRGGLIV